MARTRIIAHRGASGHLPEHSLPAKALAYGFGADFIEQDVVATRDHELVVLHDAYLDDVTDVAVRFPGRSRQDGRHHVIDFDLAELRELRVVERRKPGTDAPKFPDRFSGNVDGFRIVTLREEIEFISSLNRTTGRCAGIYPEIKEPDWHRRNKCDLLELIAAVLTDCGFSTPAANAYLQCFEARELMRAAATDGFDLRRILLLTEDDVRSHDRVAGWDAVAASVCGVGLPYAALVQGAEGRQRGALEASGLHERIRAAGLEIHAYTVRTDCQTAPAASADDLLHFLIHELEIDAIFCDQPDAALRVRDRQP